jgi:phospholipase C
VVEHKWLDVVINLQFELNIFQDWGNCASSRVRHLKLWFVRRINRMRTKTYRKAATAALGGVAMAIASSAMALAADWDGSYGRRQGRDDQGALQQKIDLLRKKVKYVFVIFHENESFDHYFGTYPGANGLFEAPRGFTPANKTESFTQRYLDTSLNVKTIQPFLMPQAVVGVGTGKVIPVYPADEISVDHGHQGMANDLDIDAKTGIAANDRYAMDQEGLTTNASGEIVTSIGAAPTSIMLPAVQKAEDDIDHLDCDTIPFMWSWAKHFVLFDNFRQTIVGPSTPNAIAIIAGQSGETQWALHPDEGATVTYANPSFPNPLGASFTPSIPGATSNAYVPIVADPGPFPGSNLDTNKVKPPYNNENALNPALNLTFATQPLSFMGSDIEKIIKKDPNPAADLRDVQGDIREIAAFNRPVNWGWYQQGFDANDTPDPFSGITPNTGPQAFLSGYVLHHNAPQYFAYLADNPAVLNTNLHGAKDFFNAVEGRTLPKDGGVFYLRGGYDNNDGLVPLDPTLGIEQAFLGNDDHPAYSDQQISEALAAEAISDIAHSPYWAQSAIIITYDETDGYYDHVAPSKRSTFADGSILEAGPRIPTIVISPYAAGGKISHQYSEHGSVMKFINELKGLVPLARLPDEERGRFLGKRNLGQDNLGPSDDPDNELGDLTEAFDSERLRGDRPPISASEAVFSPKDIKKLPHLAGTSSPNGYTNGACAQIGVLPTDFGSWTDYQNGKPIDPYSADVNPRPTQSPGKPTAGNWKP